MIWVAWRQQRPATAAAAVLLAVAGLILVASGWHVTALARDSGGALFAGSLAQSITSGGTVGGCNPSFRSFFQPADEPLSVYGLTLL